MTVRFAIIGPGGIADLRLAPALREVPGALLWSVHSRDISRARDFARRHGATAPEPAFVDMAAMLLDPMLDAVIVASPDKLHAPHAIAAAEAGKHVLVEKPMATSVAEARAMIEACRASGVQLGVGYHHRFHAGHRLLAKDVHSGALGELRHMRVLWSFTARNALGWRSHSEVGRWWSLATVGTHALDLTRWMMVPSCGEVTELRALCTRDVWGGPHEETAMVSMRFASGATAEVTASVLFDSTPTLEIFGTSGSAVCEGTLGPHGKGRIVSRGQEIVFSPSDPFVAEIADFARAIRERRAPEVGGEEGLRNVELLVRAAPARGEADSDDRKRHA
jgi:predicted dehydrogenase